MLPLHDSECKCLTSGYHTLYKQCRPTQIKTININLTK